jgi:queuine tRNA-ribosyltransferase
MFRNMVTEMGGRGGSSIMRDVKRLSKLPTFYPDATRGVVRALDNQDIESTGTPGVLVNTYHLWRMIPKEKMRAMGGVRALMSYTGSVISDSGGFQVMSIVKKSGGKVTDEGVRFKPDNSPTLLLTPEESIQYQLAMGTDLVVVLDDFTPPTATEKEARETVERTIVWAKRSKEAYEKGLRKLKISQEERPWLVAVVQGGKYSELRKECTKRLVEMEFDGYGYGGWPLTPEGEFDEATARLIAEGVPKGVLLYGLGIGKPEDVVKCVRLGWQVFDCVLPTRDARHGRLYCMKAGWEEKLHERFYEYYVPTKSEHREEMGPVDEECDCHTCRNYSRAYLYHLFKIGDATAWRLATIHNLRFYARLMERLRNQ